MFIWLIECTQVPTEVLKMCIRDVGTVVVDITDTHLKKWMVHSTVPLFTACINEMKTVLWLMANTHRIAKCNNQ